MKIFLITIIAILVSFNANAWISRKDQQTLVTHYTLGNQAWAINEECDFLNEDEKETYYYKLEEYGNFMKYAFRRDYDQVISKLHRAKITGTEAVARFGCDKRNEDAVSESYQNILELNEILGLQPGLVPQIVID